MAEPVHRRDRSPAPPSLDSPALVLRIQLLGAFQVTRGSQVVPDAAWPLRKARTLVKLLALAPGHRLHREQIQEWLWPDLAPPAAANNLRKALHIARRALDPDGTAPALLHLQEEMIRLAPPGPLWIDVEAFLAAAAQARQDRQRPAYAAALALYSGDLLPEDPYDDWAFGPRTELRATYIALLVERARLEQAHAAGEPALAAWREAVTQDPLHEEAHMGLMRLYALTGHRLQALRQYQQFEEHLRRELDVEPSAESQALYQAIADGHFPPPAPAPPPAAVPRHNLPAALTRFIGRERSVQEVGALLTRTRLLTLTGAGGCGKTRLALEVATQAVAAFPDGGWWVELAPLADPALVPQELAATLGIHEKPGQPLTPTVRDWLQDKHLLLVLDNCEHLITACAHLAERLLQACPGLHILATSREALNIAGEAAWVVPSLSIPDPTDLATPGGDPVATLLHYEASRLFADRAAAQPGFRLTPASAPAVARICKRLDGIPLALELAAARTRVLSAEQIAERLEYSFRFLTAGSRTAPPRHQTLSAALDWSHDLLSSAERALFRRLAIFAGGFTLEAAEQVGAAGDLAAPGVLDLLAHLVDKSLVLAEAPGPGTAVRYRLLEPLRQYGQERLVESGEAAATARRHAAYYLALAEQAEMELWGPEQVAWLQRLDAEHDNLRVALDWSRQHHVETGLRIAGSLWWFWDVRGYHSEGRRRLADLLPQAAARNGARAKALNCAGALALRQGDIPPAQPLLTESLAIFREIGDSLGVAGALERLGLLRYLLGDFAGSRRMLEESVVLYRGLSYQPGSGWALNDLGMLARLENDYARAQTFLESSLVDLRAAGDHRGIAYTLNNLGQLLRVQGDYGRARALLEESLAAAEAVGDKPFVGWALQCLGDVARRQGDYEQARTWLTAGLQVLRAIGETRHTAQCLSLFGVLFAAQGAYVRATRLVSAALTFQEQLRVSLDADEQADLDTTITTVRQALGEAAFARIWAEGQALTHEQAAAAALAPLSPPE